MASRLRRVLTTLAVALAGVPAAADERVVVRSDVLFYGDDTEFHNPFREGETIFGAAARVTVEVQTSERVTLSLGGFINQRFGSDKTVEMARPVVAVAVHGPRSRFVIGTFGARDLNGTLGPDHMGPHGLLPPLQRDTLAFERPYEAGLRWTFAGGILRHDVWLAWQKLNTPAHRERFDGGFDFEVRASRHVSLPAQVHFVHEGGQLHEAGVVSDSPAAALGVKLHGRPRPFDQASLEVFGLVSRFIPDRSRRELTRDGVAFLGRAAAERRGWRAHLIVWRGRNFIKEEGDPHYLSRFQDGRRYRGTRDYSEAGLARRLLIGPSLTLEVSGRLHRVEKDWDYSGRVAGCVTFGWRVR